MDITDITDIMGVDLSNKNLTELPNDLDYDNVTHLNISHNNLTNIDKLLSCKKLITLICNNNQITSLCNLPSSLVSISCQYNQINVINNIPIHLQLLNCCHNLLIDLDISYTNIKFLYCSFNQLTSLTLLPATTLRSLMCISNNLSFLRLPKSVNMLYCHANPLRYQRLTIIHHVNDVHDICELRSQICELVTIINYKRVHIAYYWLSCGDIYVHRDIIGEIAKWMT